MGRMKIRCGECRERFEISPHDSLDAVTCSACGSVFSLLGDTVMESRGPHDTVDEPGTRTTISELDDPEVTQDSRAAVRDELERTQDSRDRNKAQAADQGSANTKEDATTPEAARSKAKATIKEETTADDNEPTTVEDDALSGETVDYRFEPGGSKRRPTLQRIGKFELLEMLGSGSFGTVWRARDTDLDRKVAIKVPRGWRMDEDEMKQFMREARTAAQLKHPNIVGIHEVGSIDDTVYIVSDLITGSTMQEWAAERTRTPREIVDVCILIARALNHAHDNGVVHRDLKPANILMNEKGEPFIADFGLAK